MYPSNTESEYRLALTNSPAEAFESGASIGLTPSLNPKSFSELIILHSNPEIEFVYVSVYQFKIKSSLKDSF